MKLYMESRAARADQANAVSGRIIARPRFGYSGCLTCGVLGTEQVAELKVSLKPIAE